MRVVGLAVALLAVAVAGQWELTVDLAVARYDHSATLLQDGRVLLVGGYDYRGVCLASAEIFDPSTGHWNLTEELYFPRCHHTATLLNDGRVFVTGGQTDDGQYLASTEVFDPTTGVWTSDETDYLTQGRAFHAAVVMARGDVLVSGGFDGSNYLTSVVQWRVDTPTSPWNAVGDLKVGRANHTMTRMDTDRIVVIGGNVDGQDVTATSEFCTNQAFCTWAYTTTEMNFARAHHTATLFDGPGPTGLDVLVVGGLDGNYQGVDDTELYDASYFRAVSFNEYTPRYSAQVVRLDSGDGMIIGGYNTATGEWIQQIEFYNPQTRRWRLGGVDNRINAPRADFTATVLRNGNVLIAGGRTEFAPVTDTAEIYYPELE